LSPALADLGCDILCTASPASKVRLTEQACQLWRAGKLATGTASPPDRPARPARPEQVAPGQVTRRSRGRKGRIALLHAVAHIELNAIDLAWDLIVRFSGEDLPAQFYTDWVRVAGEEALHFTLLLGRLAAYDATYGDFPVHGGMWEAASGTADDILARLAIVPLVLEARGLDITPAMIARFEREGDPDTAAVLTRILSDEVGHVRAGQHWFEHIATARGLDPETAFKHLIKLRFRGKLKPPFNVQLRDQAGIPRAYYAPEE